MATSGGHDGLEQALPFPLPYLIDVFLLFSLLGALTCGKEIGQVLW